jgi:hypothetical protein
MVGMTETIVDTGPDADLLAHMRRRGFLVNERAGWCAERRERVAAREGFERDGKTYTKFAAMGIASDELEDIERTWRANNTPDEEL